MEKRTVSENSGRMTNRQLAALETKKKLIETAKRIICEKGLVNTSIEEITKACGVSNGTFYTYFKRKEDIVFELSRDVYREIFEEAQAYDGTFMQRLVFFMTNFSGYIEKSSLKLCQEWVRNTVDPALVKNESDKNKLQLDIDSVKELVKSGVERGELIEETPADILAHTLIDLLYGEMLCWDMSGGAYSFEARTKEFCDTFLNSLIKPYIKP
ncbi:MAG TPA: TetR/AcrR family transcriptional regulator [Candidatus Monoglobus merdigallinarum]|uniref:TetR/AcrR family transcriptional regulator n=1 Tax=Candidatus Monoglobus merdigallinarum TaxID=2838698 RepID=A0A9D1TLQ2_9FIRM|nr:TetR/AcrR family transcriptional regulator [Candidatus Monoglobus merdigallinarum]